MPLVSEKVSPAGKARVPRSGHVNDVEAAWRGPVEVRQPAGLWVPARRAHCA